MWTQGAFAFASSVLVDKVKVGNYIDTKPLHITPHHAAPHRTTPHHTAPHCIDPDPDPDGCDINLERKNRKHKRKKNKRQAFPPNTVTTPRKGISQTL